MYVKYIQMLNTILLFYIYYVKYLFRVVFLQVHPFVKTILTMQLRRTGPIRWYNKATGYVFVRTFMLAARMFLDEAKRSR